MSPAERSKLFGQNIVNYFYQSNVLVSSVRHSSNEFLKICSTYLLHGHWTAMSLLALYLVRQHCWLHAGYRWINLDPAILESQMATAPPQATSTYPSTFSTSWETTTMCQRSCSPVPVDVIICNHSFSVCLKKAPLDLTSRDCNSLDPCPEDAEQPLEPLGLPCEFS